MSKIKVKAVYTVKGSSELGPVADQIRTDSIAKYDSKIFGLVDILEMGFAKTKVTVEFEDGETATFDCDFNLTCKDGLADSIKYVGSAYWEEMMVVVARMRKDENYVAARKAEIAEFNAKYDWGLE